MKEVEPEKGLADEQVTLDPFDGDNVHIVNAIVLMRIYDMLGAILDHLAPEVAEELVNKHSQGKILGPFPSLDL